MAKPESNLIMQELEAKRSELTKTREELSRAKESTMQSWLDSKPLLDELERLKSKLQSAKNRSNASKVTISDLLSRLDSIKSSIRSKMEEEFKTKEKINELTQILDQTRQELEINYKNLETDHEQLSRSKLKQTLKLRRQNLRTSQLKLRAARIELEAFKLSRSNALYNIDCLKQDTSTNVQLSHEEYFELIKRAEDAESLADWRVSKSNEQKLATEARLKKPRRSVERLKEKEKKQEEIDVEYSSGRVEAPVKNRRNTPQQIRRSRSSKTNKKMKKKKKVSIFRKIRRCIARSISRLFG